VRKIIEYTLMSVDGVVTGPRIPDFLAHQDDAYLRDGLGQLLACEAMLFGRTTFEEFARRWPGREDHPWAERINTMPKYVVSSTLDHPEWSNSTVIRGDVVTEVTKLKDQPGGDLLVYGHGLLSRALLAAGLIDVLDVSVHPLLAGTGGQLFREGESAKLRLVASKSFSHIVKLTYEPQQ
jgi:dihydrofolate reductase